MKLVRACPLILLLLCGLTVAQTPTERVYDLEAGSLARVLGRFAAESDLLLSADASLTAGKQSDGLRGRYTVREGLGKLLAGSGLRARFTDESTVTLEARETSARALEAVKVTSATGGAGDGLTSEGSGAYGSYGSTIGKTPQSLRETPQSVSVLTRQRLDDQNVTDLPEAMKYVTGVTVQRFDGAGYFNSFNARGYPADTFQLDGINVATNANMTDTDLVVYDRVEIQRGAAGLFQGSGEPGVTVNLVRKRAEKEKRARGLVSAGSWDTYRAEADLTGGLTEDGRLRGRLVAAHDDRGSYMDGVNGDKQVAYGTLEYDVTDSMTLSLGGTWQQVDSITNQGLPLGPGGALLDLPRSTAIVADWTTLDMETSDLFGEMEQRLDNGGSVKVALRHVQRDRTYRSIQAASLTDAAGNFDGLYYIVPNELEDTSADVYWNTPFAFAGRHHELVLGADYRTGENTTRYGEQIYDPAGGQHNIDDFNDFPEPDVVAGGASPSVTDTDQYGVYARTRLRLTDRVSALLGSRLTWWDSESRNLGTGAVTGEYQADREITPYAALMYDLSDQWAVYTSYAEIFKPQNATTRTGDQIKPRTGEQYELGVKGELMAGRLNTHAAIYRIDDQNRALTDPADPQFSIAAGEARSEGLETEISGYLTERWQLTAGYAYTDTEYRRGEDDQSGEDFSPITPEHSANLWGKYRFTEGGLAGLDLGAGVRAVSGFYNATGANRVDAPGYAVLALFGQYRVNENLSLALNLDNVLDKKYYEKVNAGTRQNFYGTPRSALLTLRASF